MEARKVQIKLFIDGNAAVDPDPFVPVFHRFIRENTLREVLIDVTDYAHVKDAPAVLLVGHGSDYAIDLGGGRPGLLYSRKRDGLSDVKANVLDALRRALFAAARLEEEKGLPAPVRFRTDELLFRVNDRLHAPNTDATFASVKALLADTLGKVLGDGTTFERTGSARELLTVKIASKNRAPVAELLRRVE